MRNRSPFDGITAGRVHVSPGPSGFLEHASLDGLPVLDASGKPGFTGVCLDVFVPSDPSERFPVAGQVIAAPVAGVDAGYGDGAMTVRTQAATHGVGAVYEAQCVPGDGDRLLIDLAVAVSGRGWLASVGIALPLSVGPDPLRRCVTVGGERRNEVWRMDQNDEDTSEDWQKKVSDTRARWPLWRIGGLLVDAPHHYLIWKSSELTTPPLPMDQGTRCPGWVDYSERSRGIRVHWVEMQQHAPAGMTVDGDRGLLWIWLHPPAVRPIRVTGTYTRTARLIIDFHA